MHFQPTNKDLSQLPKGIAALIEKQTASRNETSAPSRRQFLKMSVAGGFALGMFPAMAQTDKAPPGLKAFEQPLAFLQIANDGTVTVTINRLEFGQGVHTALPMILAEELDVDWSKVKAIHGSADPAYVDPAFGMHLTGGSGSIKNSYKQYRELGARARAMLVAAAAAQWQVNPDTLRTDRSAVIRADGKTLSYAELANTAMKLAVPDTVKLKDPKTFKIIGKQVGRLDAKDKSTGQQQFGIDVHLPGMLTAVIAHPPVFGAKLRSFDDSAAKQIKGVRAVLKIAVDRGGEGVAIIADGFWPAKQGRDALKVDWDSSGVDKVDSLTQLKQYQDLAKTTGKLHFDADVSKLATATKKISAEFTFPYLAHAAMEPLNCTVQLSADKSKAELWVGTQMPGVETMAAAQTLGISPQHVMLHVQMAGGGFGRRAVPNCDYVIESCQVAKAAHAAGIQAPIRTIWSREDDIKGGYYRPMHVHRAEIGLDEQGQIQAWDHVIVGQSIVSGTPFEGFLVKKGIDGTAIEGMRDPYEIPMRLSVHHPKVNVPVLWWRSVGSTHTAYVMETLIDEIARNAKQDPVAYRLKQFGDKHPRHTAALKLAVEKSGYNKRRLPKGHAWGVAVHESFETVVAYVVTASIQNGQAKLHTATAGVHCNLAVNPKTIEAQVQGAALMGLGMCLENAAITLKDGVVEQSNFGDYAVARITDMPQVSVHIVPSADPPTGMGEPGLPPLAPAFGNAIAKLVGKAPRSLPFKLS
ncbi:xanthine dehydrogenase family protein molybdopterin-binding subunit [Undibacterium seohonense]|uniref:Xanthine dehydrogenase family protein molybdopterin-binding subunit n=1 Tax=Undibacterium seohonense TaxID=1344950 RepID=A0ABR6X042_9BURK|nr:xanthine dehydrogenase family protein molybdopterin-binding subunit [Undibacterium seohonense]MBC3806033.1 xanthine dehydrogenase family protein molybdopterin-binding subunit [Undibacterium seohonense]